MAFPRLTDPPQKVEILCKPLASHLGHQIYIKSGEVYILKISTIEGSPRMYGGDLTLNSFVDKRREFFMRTRICQNQSSTVREILRNITSNIEFKALSLSFSLSLSLPSTVYSMHLVFVGLLAAPI